MLKHLGRKTGNIYFDAIVIECLHEIIWALYIFIVMMIMMMTEMILFFGILREFSKWNSVYSQHLIEMWTEETLCGCTCFEVIFRHLSNICEKKSKYENKMQTKTMCDFAFLSLRLQSACLLSRFNRVTWARTRTKTIPKKSPLFSCLNWNFETRNINELSANYSSKYFNLVE